MDVAAYLRRLRYTGTIEPTLNSLRSLHRRHMEVVPFENLDIALSGGSRLTTRPRFAKSSVAIAAGSVMS